MPTSFGNGTSVTSKALNTTFGLKADLVSPALTGVPSAPTATANTSTTQLATTAFVTTANNLKQNLPVGVAWTPTLGLGSWTNITFTGRYVQANKLVQFWILGTATGACVLSTGFTPPAFNFPVVPQNTSQAGTSFVVTIADVSSSSTFNGTTVGADVLGIGVIRPLVGLATGTYTSMTAILTTAPMTWASGDTIFIQGVYEAL